MVYVPVPNDLNRIKTKLTFNLTKRQLICFSIAGGIGVPFYLFTRSHIGNSIALFLMIGLMLPCFLFAMYEKDDLPFEKVLRNIIRVRFLTPRMRPWCYVKKKYKLNVNFFDNIQYFILPAFPFSSIPVHTSSHIHLVKDIHNGYGF